MAYAASNWASVDLLMMTHTWNINSMRCRVCGVALIDLWMIEPKDQQPCALWVEEGL